MKKAKKEYKITACLTEAELKTLERLCKKYDRTKSWVIGHLLSAVVDDPFPETPGDDAK
jgi:hypothetical protein